MNDLAKEAETYGKLEVERVASSLDGLEFQKVLLDRRGWVEAVLSRVWLDGYAAAIKYTQSKVASL